MLYIVGKEWPNIFESFILNRFGHFVCNPMNEENKFLQEEIYTSFCRLKKMIQKNLIFYWKDY